MNYTKENRITSEEIEWLENNYSQLFRKSSVFNRLPDILQYRLINKTLQEIANIYNVTRGRIAQMEAMAVEIIKQEKLKK